MARVQRASSCSGLKSCQDVCCRESKRVLVTQPAVDQDPMGNETKEQKDVLATRSTDYYQLFTTVTHLLLIVCNILILITIVSLLIKTPLPDEITIGNRTYVIERYKILSVARKSFE